MCGLRHDRLYTFFGSYHTTSGVEGLSALLLVGPWVFDCVDAGHFFGAPLYNISWCFVFFNQGLCIGLKHFLLIVKDTHRVVHRDCRWCRGALLDRACALSQDGFWKRVQMTLVTIDTSEEVGFQTLLLEGNRRGDIPVEDRSIQVNRLPKRVLHSFASLSHRLKRVNGLALG